jgi:hypothetical protein
MKYYRANWRGITEFDIIRETEMSVIFKEPNKIKETREVKKTSFYSWHKTKEDAVQYLIEKEQRTIECAQTQIIRAKQEIEKIRQY